MKNFRILGILVLMLGGSFCSTLQEDGVKSEVVTAENQAALLEQADAELSYAEVELLHSFLRRAEAQTGEARLPAGKTIGEIIESERVLSALNEPENATPPADPLDEAQPANPAARQATPPAAQAPARSSAESETTLGFEEEAPSSESAAVEATAEPAAEAAAPATVVLPSGTPLRVRLTQSISSKTANPGDTFEAQLEDDLVVDGRTVARDGDRVVGTIPDAKASGKVKGKAQMSLQLSEIVTGEGTYSIDTNTLRFEAQDTKGRDAKRIGIATGVGAVIGAIAGGGKGAAIGTAIGAGAGTGVTLATAGEEVEFATEQLFEFKLDDGVTLPILD